MNTLILLQEKVVKIIAGANRRSHTPIQKFEITEMQT